MKRWLLIFAVASSALAQAALVVKPYGDQVIRADGSQVLKDGGIVEDNRLGFKIDAKYLEVKDGEFVRAKTATIKNTKGQSIRSSELEYQIKQDRMSLAGPLEYSDENVSGLKAGKAVAYPDAGRVVAFGGVKATSPMLEAQSIVVDSKKSEAFLYGAYKYKSKDGKISRSSPSADAMMLVNFSNRDKPKIVTGSEIPASVKNVYLEWIQKSQK